jgi:hypothetical protein
MIRFWYKGITINGENSERFYIKHWSHERYKNINLSRMQKVNAYYGIYVMIQLILKPISTGNFSWNFIDMRYAASVVMCIAYARRIDSMDAKVMHGVNDAMEFVGSLNVPGAYLAETFPFLKYIPTFLAPWKRTVQRKSKEDAEFFGNLALEVKQREDMGKPVPDCFVKSLIEVHPVLFG